MWRWFIMLGAICLPGLARAQALWIEIREDFPASAAYAEYYDVASLRSSPNYQALKTLYLSTQAAKLIDGLAKFGITEEDLTEVVIGSQNITGQSGLFGVISAPLPKQVLANRVRRRQLQEATIGTTRVFCQPSETGGLCLAVLDDVLSAVGSFERLKAIVDTRQNLRLALREKAEFIDLLADHTENSPIQGLSDGHRLAAWLNDALQDQAAAAIDWKKLLPEVTAFAYTVRLATTAHIELHLSFKSENQALASRQLLKMVALGSVAMNGDPAQIHNFEVGGAERRVDISLDAPLPHI